jgi:uncharacterized repeat protein (TIGR03803 family)
MEKTVRGYGLLAFACAFTGMGVPPAQAQSATEVVLHNFANLPHGANPWAGVIRDSAGNLYGTATSGGTGLGVVYIVDAAGQERALHSFAGGADGAIPQAGVIRDSAGNFYGTTLQGGVGDYGVVYKLDAAGQETVLYSFTGGDDGANPTAGVIRDAAGNLYGTASRGGIENNGVVFKLDNTGQESLLYAFMGGADGGAPASGVIRDSAGNLYGTTQFGGTAHAGVIYKVSTTGQETVLYSFTCGANGGNPQAGVVRDAAGNLYGTAGVVYELSAAGQYTVLYSFSGGADGSATQTGVIRDAAGNLYGTTYQGGTAGYGVVYKLSPNSQETVLYTFTRGADGGSPQAGVVRDAAGNLYGTTVYGGIGTVLFSAGLGIVYKLDAMGQETVLYSFPGAAGGTEPYAGVIADAAGNLYGTTLAGGPANQGVVFKLSPKGLYTVLYSFTGGDDGGSPQSGVTRDSTGNLYGTAYGGTTGWGVVYRVNTAGQETVLYNFTGGADGGIPLSGVIRDPAGNLYGTTCAGGSSFGGPGYGVVYKLDTSGNQTVLHTFTGYADGAWPRAGLIFDSAGNLYGTTSQGNAEGPGNAGVVFELDSAGQETVLYTFTDGADGGVPFSGVIRDAAGNLYGTTYLGGTAGAGVVYKLEPGGYETVLYTFPGGTLGGSPTTGVILDPAGNVYGANGVIYEVDTAGNYSVLWGFPNAADGTGPSGLIRDPAGNLYGTTSAGGIHGGGVVFKLKLQ